MNKWKSASRNQLRNEQVMTSFQCSSIACDRYVPPPPPQHGRKSARRLQAILGLPCLPVHTHEHTGESQQENVKIIMLLIHESPRSSGVVGSIPGPDDHAQVSLSKIVKPQLLCIIGVKHFEHLVGGKARYEWKPIYHFIWVIIGMSYFHWLPVNFDPSVSNCIKNRHQCPKDITTWAREHFRKPKPVYIAPRYISG